MPARTKSRELNKNKSKKNLLKFFSKKGRIDMPFFILTITLLTIGLVMLFSATYAYALYTENNSLFYISKQFVFAIIGVVAMILISFIDYHVLKKYCLLIFSIAMVLLVVVLFMPEVKGVHRWILIGPINFQPSEIMKFAIVVLFAAFIATFAEKMGTFKYGVIPFMIVLGVVCALMILQPHISGTALIGMIGLLMMFVGGTKYKYFLIAGITVLVLAVAFIMFIGVDYLQAKLKGWVDPFSDVRGNTYQTVQSLLAIGSGGILGEGLGNSKQKHLYLPEPQNDFIFSIVTEELGFIGALIIIILFILFIFRGFTIAIKSKDKFGMMLAFGLTAQIGLQVLFNIAVITNTIPNTGISLPFFSYGGTALVMQLAQMGVVLSVSRQAILEKE